MALPTEMKTTSPGFATLSAQEIIEATAKHQSSLVSFSIRSVTTTQAISYVAANAAQDNTNGPQNKPEKELTVAVTKQPTAIGNKRKHEDPDTADKENITPAGSKTEEPVLKRQKPLPLWGEQFHQHIDQNSDSPLNQALPFMSTDDFIVGANKVLSEHGHGIDLCPCLDGKCSQVLVTDPDEGSTKGKWVPTEQSTLPTDFAIEEAHFPEPMFYQDQSIHNISDRQPVFLIDREHYKNLKCPAVVLHSTPALADLIAKKRHAYYETLGFTHTLSSDGSLACMYGDTQRTESFQETVDLEDENAVARYGRDTFPISKLPITRVEVDHDIETQVTYKVTYALNEDKTGITRKVEVLNTQDSNELEDQTGVSAQGPFYRGETAETIPQQRVELESVDTMTRLVLATYTLYDDNIITRTVQTLKNYTGYEQSEVILSEITPVPAHERNTVASTEAIKDADKQEETVMSPGSEASTTHTPEAKTAEKPPTTSVTDAAVESQPTDPAEEKPKSQDPSTNTTTSTSAGTSYFTSVITTGSKYLLGLFSRRKPGSLKD